MKSFFFSVAVLLISGKAISQQKPTESFLPIVIKATEAKIISNYQSANIDAANKFELSKFWFSAVKDTSIALQRQITITYSFFQLNTANIGLNKKGSTKQSDDWKILLVKNEQNEWDIIKCGYY